MRFVASSPALLGVALIIVLTIVVVVAQPAKQCPSREIYNECGTACPATCDSIKRNDGPKICTANCVIGCFCDRGYVRNTNSGRCVVAEDCP
ncbi:hypothetical protein RP20_CCG017355 [Aedes albopictus]|nr:chymotrypsin inhibitor-like [Aedes albopictus]KXJ81878.1 hypothetical protein RP20_CCG017355 [Aedes albopictus]